MNIKKSWKQNLNLALMNRPLAERLRPQSLDEVIGQEHLIGKDKPLRKMVEGGTLRSVILWGPPGVGKTTIARILAETCQLPFEYLSAIQSGVKDIRAVIEKARMSGTVILFIDEIHRFSKSQQDALLGAVEDGTIVLIGATTENPSFEVISPLLSRCQVYIMESLGVNELSSVINRAVTKDEYLSKLKIDFQEKTALYEYSGGDARKLLNLLELVLDNLSEEKKIINDEKVKQIVQNNIARYDKSGEQHYDIISAFIKSMRGSDPNAALYWLARMLVSGEDPKFIARRILIFASEDVGLANPNGILIAEACFRACEVIGMPECRIILSQAVTYLASSPKSNSAYLAIDKAMQLAERTSYLPVPLHLRNAPTKLMKEIGYGNEYLYPHNFPGHFVQQEYMPNELQGNKIFEPQLNLRENELKKYLSFNWNHKYEY
ncbi:MAG: replication-associated recombination protein A [Chitinophagales bacterium]|nr:replication-associated recombination protein A [Chitinophagales bacterium]MCZ2393174.1 replication-associated recombination protein A [Chitinophagales bacterium]